MSELTRENFNKVVLESKQPVVIDFWAPWCVPCRQIAPTIDSIADSYKGRIACHKVNIDENQHLAMDLSVMNIPTVMIFKGGKETGRIVGVSKKDQLEAKIKAFISE